MPHCNTKAPVHIISLKWNFEKLLLVTCGSTKACFAVLHIKGWISSVLRCLLWLAFSFVQSNDAWQAAWFPLAGSEVAWYNSYSLAKVLHSSDFQCVMHNMDKITKWIAAFSMDINGTLITWVTCVSNPHPSLLSMSRTIWLNSAPSLPHARMAVVREWSTQTLRDHSGPYSTITTEAE